MNQDDRPTTILPVLPLDDAVVLPGMNVTFPITNEEEAEAIDGSIDGRLVLVPRVEGRFALRHRRRDRGRHDPARRHARRLAEGAAPRRARPGRRPRRDGLRVGVRERPDPETRAPRPPSWCASTGPWSRRSPSSGARARASGASCAASPTPAAWPTPRATPPRSRSRRRSRSSRPWTCSIGCASPWRPSATAWPTPRLRRRIRDDVNDGMESAQREFLLRRQMEAIQKELGEEGPEGDDWAAHRGGRDARGGPEGGRARARPPGAQLRRPRGRHDPHLPGVDGLAALERALGGPPGDRRGARGAGRRPRRPGEGQGAGARVPRRAQAAARARHERRHQRRDPDAGGAAGHRQDLARASRSPAPWGASSPA